MRIARTLKQISGLGALTGLLLAPLTISAAQINLTWDRNTESNIAGYKIWYSRSGSATFIDVGNVTSATIPNLADGSTYSFSATAYNSDGLESSPSAAIVYLTPGVTVVNPPPPSTNTISNTDPGSATVLSAPVFTTSPAAQTVSLGGVLQLTSSVTGSTPMTFQWSHNFVPIPGATTQNWQVPNVSWLDGGFYSLTASNSVGSALSLTAYVQVQNTPFAPTIIAGPSSQTVALGGTLTLAAQAAGSAPLTWQWFHNGIAIPNATAITLQLANVQTSDQGDYTVRVSNSVNSVTSASAVINVTSSTSVTLPAILTQPSDQIVALGNPISLLVQANGTAPLAFQWYRNGTAISGANNATLQISSTQAADTGSYTVQVSNSAGSVTSTSAQINVILPPNVTVQPLSQSLTAGDTLNLSVQSVGSAPLQYQWYRDAVLLPGETLPSLQISGIDASSAGSYTVTVSNSAGSQTSTPASINIYTPPPVVAPSITGQPVSQTLAPGATLNLSVQVSGSGPLQFQWYQNGSGVLGGNASTLQIPSVQSRNGGTYTVTASNAAGTANSSPAVITVLGPPAITQQPASQNLAVGTALDLTVQATGSGPLQYQWFRDGYAIAYATSATLHIPSVRISDAGSYTVNVSNTSGSIPSTAAVILVLVAPTITVQPASQSLAIGTSLNLSVSVSGSDPLSYQWFHGGDPIANATGPNLQIVAAQTTDAGAYSVRITNTVGIATTTTAMIDIKNAAIAPSIVAQPDSQNVVLGSSLTLTVVATGSAPLQYQWFKGAVMIQNAAGATLQIPTVQLSDAGAYTVTVLNSAGSATTVPTLVNVLTPPAILAQPRSQTLTVGATLKLSVAATGSEPMTYQWYHDGVLVPNATSATLQTASVQISDTGSYNVKVANDAGTIMSAVAIVGISAAVTAPTITVQPLSQNIAVGAQLALSVTATGSNLLQYQWFRNGIAISYATSALLKIDGAQITDSGSYSVNVSNSTGSVPSAPAIVNVLTPPGVTLQPKSQSLTIGAALNLTVIAAGSPPLAYQWFRNGTPLPNATTAAFSILNFQDADSGSYTVQISNAVASAVSAEAIIAPIGAPTITTGPVSQTLSFGDTLRLSVQAAGAGPLQYQWSLNGAALRGATSSNYRVNALKPTDVGTYSATVTGPGGSVTSAPAVVSVIMAPAVTTQPIPQTLSVESPLLLSAEVTGSMPLQYQWYKDGGAVNGATSSSLQITSVQTKDAGSYTLKISNSAGTANSRATMVTIISSPSLIQQPGNLSLTIGAGLNLNVQAAGTGPLEYQWFRNGSLIPGAISSNFQIEAVQATDAGTYIVHVSNSAGSATSDPAVVRVLTSPTIFDPPGDQIVIAGSPLTLSVQASGSGPLQYFWSHNGNLLSDGTNSLYRLETAQSSDAGLYAVKIWNEAGAVTSTVASVTVLLPPTIVKQPVAQILTPGSTLSLNVQVTGSDPILYQWFRNGAVIPNATSSTFQLSSVGSNDAGSYSVRAANSAGVATSDTANVVIASSPSITVNPTSQTVLAGTSVTLSVQATGSGLLQYQWFRDGIALPSTGSTLALPTVATTDAGSYKVTVSNSAGDVTSTPAQLTVLAAPAITTQPASQMVQVGSAFTIAVQASGSGPLQYQWFHNGSVVTAGTSATLSVTSAQPGDGGSYSVTVANSAGLVTSSAATITIQATPVITAQPLSQNLAVGAPLSLVVQFTGSNVQLQWLRNGIALDHADAPVLEISSAQITDSGSYTVILSNAVGVVTSSIAKVAVLVPPTITQQPSGEKTSNGARTTLSVGADGSNLSYQWYKDGQAISGATTNSYTFSAVPKTIGNYTVRVSNSVGLVTSVVVAVTLTPGNGNVVATAASLSEPIRLSLDLSTQSGIVLRSIGISGHTYEIQATDDLGSTDWTSIALVNASQTGEIEYTDQVPVDGKAKFYRAVSH